MRIGRTNWSSCIDCGKNFWQCRSSDLIEKKNIYWLRPTHFVIRMHGGKNSFHCRIITLIAGDIEVHNSYLGGRRSDPTKNDEYHHNCLGLEHVHRVPP